MNDLLFFVGLHQPADTRHFERSFVSVNRLRKRRSDFPVRDWIMDSGAFTEISKHGRYRASEEAYAEQIDRWRTVGQFRAAAIQDYMCEAHILKITGLTVPDHQRLTLERYDRLRELTTAPLLPVLQGYAPEEYVQHIDDYGSRLRNGAWVGVGSICKRNKNVSAVEDVLLAIKRHRRDLRLHGFGLKITALASGTVRECLATADSMAWSDAARTKDPDVRYTPKGTAVVELGLAINRKYTTDSGEKREEATFLDVTFWGKTAETIGKYLTKGNPLYVEGRLQLDTWDDRETGQKRSKLRVVGESMQFLGGKDREAAPDRGDRDKPAGYRQPKPAAPAKDRRPEDNPGNMGYTGDDDDVPF